MENYNYDFINYTNGIDRSGYQMNMMPSYMGNNISNKMNYIPNQGKSEVVMMGKNQILDPYQAFMRGNAFSELYDQYKGYKPGEINPTSEREAMLEQWQQYNFILTDLNLYLDMHPEDREALSLYNKYLSIKEQICKKYESTYGPITLDSSDLGTNNWKWINGPWPWEGIK